MLREAMYKGFYLLDTVRYRQQSSNDQVGNQPSAPHSWFHINPAKHKSFYRSMNLEFQDDGVKNVQKMLGNLHNIMGDMAEFIFFLKFYPPMSREPYSMHLFLENCVFGCKAEMEKIVGFLLQPEPPGTDNLQVLQIIGPPRVGKSTLVEHICYDERVHNHFSSFILCNGDPTAPDSSGIVKKESHGSQGKSLIIMELADDLVLEDKVCRKLYSSRRHMPPGSKVIITSRSENIVKLGSIGAIILEFLSHEAYWYFFKQPELASMAMKLATELDGSFLSAKHFWLLSESKYGIWIISIRIIP
ncbi:hypothetical protein QOZ80_1BG0081430 [Eleusine coracana subsp. coracana]|nr:hypothetical protein QOZ80_1BG0081430 [Eleusine coracana subsp. coracana]